MVAEAFTLLQDGRHNADYDLTVEFLPIEAGNLLTYAIEACDAWALVRETSNAAVFLTAFLLHERRNRRG